MVTKTKETVYNAAMERVRRALLEQNEMPPLVLEAYEKVELWVLSSELVHVRMRQLASQIMDVRADHVQEMRQVSRLTRQPLFQTETEFRADVLDDHSPDAIIFIDEVADHLEQLTTRRVGLSRNQMDEAIQEIQAATDAWLDAELSAQTGGHKRHAHIFDAESTKNNELVRTRALLRTTMEPLRSDGPVAAASSFWLRRTVRGQVRQLRTVATPQRVADAKLIRSHSTRLYELPREERFCKPNTTTCITGWVTSTMPGRPSTTRTKSSKPICVKTRRPTST